MINILGSYITKFGELWDQSLLDLLKEASFGAAEDAGLDLKDINAIYVANMAAGGFENQRHLGALASSLFPHQPPSTRIEAACASGGLAVLAAQDAINSGRFETVLVVGVEKMTDVSTDEATRQLASAADINLEYGSTFPGLYALLAQEHMRKFGTTREHLSAVAAKNHKHALKNPQAQFHKEFSIEQISHSVPVADPLRLLDCSPISDGAAGIILKKEEGKKEKTKNRKPVVSIIGSGQGQDTLDLAGRKSLTELKATKVAADQAFKKAGISPDQIQAAEVHDCFTIAEILAIEDIGFFKKGEGGKAIESGQTELGGKLIINPSGGLKACGHPVGATGVKQLAFLSKYLIENNLQYGLTHNVGGSGATCAINIIAHQPITHNP